MGAYTEFCPKRVSNNCLLNLYLHQWELPSSRAGWSRGTRKDCREVGPTPSLRTRFCFAWWIWVHQQVQATAHLLSSSPTHMELRDAFKHILLKFTLYFYIFAINVCVEHMLMPSRYIPVLIYNSKNPLGKHEAFFYNIHWWLCCSLCL